MKSTQWFSSAVCLFEVTFAQVFNYDNLEPNQPQTNNNQDASVQNSWSGTDLSYGNQDGYELPVQPDYYQQQLQRLGGNDQDQVQEYRGVFRMFDLGIFG